MIGPRQKTRHDLNALAYAQAGFFTAAQAKAIGYPYQAQKYHSDRGNWLKVDRGLYRLPGWPHSREDGYVRWVLWSGNRGVVSHESALEIHDLSDVSPPRVHLTVPSGFRAVHEAVVIHRGSLAAPEIVWNGSWAVTSVDRTLVDVAGSALSPEHVEAAVRDAVERGLTTARRLRRLAHDAEPRAALGLERALSLAVAP